MNISDKLKELMEERGWTEYRLVAESGVAASTVANIFHRGTVPGIYTLKQLCDAFGITLAQFFGEGETTILSEEQSELLKNWSKLSKEQRKCLMDLMKTMAD